MKKQYGSKGFIKQTVKHSFVFALTMGALLGLAGCAKTADSGSTSGSTAASSAESTTGSASASNDSAEVKTINIGLSSTSSKNHFFTDDGKETGYEYELIKALDEELPQYSINIITQEFPSLFVSLDASTVDAVVGNLRRSEQRDESYLHTYRAYNYSPYRILVESTDDTINSIADLNGKKLGISQGSLQTTILDEYQKKNNISIEYVYTKDYTNDLVAGRIDAFISPEFSLEAYNLSFENIKFKAVGEVIASETGSLADSNAYIYLAHGSEALRDDLSEAIYKLRESGKLTELNTKFYDKDYIAEIEVNHEEELVKELKK
jgi:L-cystine transport system substrate-binding protein